MNEVIFKRQQELKDLATFNWTLPQVTFCCCCCT